MTLNYHQGKGPPSKATNTVSGRLLSHKRYWAIWKDVREILDEAKWTYW
jgi:hypothetical protein